MSEAARQLNMRIVTRDAMAVEAMAKRMDAPLESREDLIDAAVAPLVEAVRDLLAWVEPLAGDNSNDEESARELATVERVNKALAPWRK